MAEFSYKPALQNNIITQYIGHRRSLATFNLFDKSPDRLVSYQTAIIQNEIGNASAGAQHMMGQICCSLDSGFQMLSSHLKETNYKLGEINDTLNSMYAMLDERLDMMIYTQRETNSLLKDLLRISVIPDRQKDSYAYLEKAITFFNAAVSEGFDSDLYSKVHSNLNSAIELDNDNFITHFYLGQLVLNSQEFLETELADKNLETAEKNLIYSAKLAKILALSDYEGNQTALFNSYQFGKKITNREAFNFEAASALISASKVAYLQLKFNNAEDYCRQAIILTPFWTEPLYRLSKALAARGNGKEAAEYLKTAILIDRFQTLKILQDEDLYEKKEIQEMITDLTTWAREEANIKYNKCKEVVIPDSVQKNVIQEIESYLSTSDYLTSLKVIDIINEKKARAVDKYYVNLQNGPYYGTVGVIQDGITSDLIDFFVFEANQVERNEAIKKESVKILQDLERRRSSCFIATVCYESANAPEVVILRSFRDNTLLKTPYGRLFVKFYSKVSPSIAKILGKSGRATKFVRKYLLDPLVGKLTRRS